MNKSLPLRLMRVIRGNRAEYTVDISECVWNMLCNLNKFGKIDHNHIQNRPGVYVFWGWDDQPIRIGKAKLLRNRILMYANSYQESSKQLWDVIQDKIQYVSVIYTSNQESSQLIENDLLNTHRPEFNLKDLDNI